MKKKHIKKLKETMRIIQVEWLHSLLSEEDAKQITVDNVSTYLSDQTHTFMQGKLELSFMSDRWIIKQLKRNPAIKTYKELEQLNKQIQGLKEATWTNL
tara:strand:- start:453 stop:749 length:297 start_codon:yes stop_codon:yes gene_type:complete